jgi:hypothetical protein
MKLLRPRFSLKTMLAAMTLAAAASYVLVLPSVRAERFAKLINEGDRKSAEAMLPASMKDTSLHRHTIQRATSAAVAPITAAQLLGGTRHVIVTEDSMTFSVKRGAEENVTAEYIVHRTTISSGYHTFFLW